MIVLWKSFLYFLSMNSLGECICNHNTKGASCELCQDGFYGNALEGTPYDCQPCPCPGGTKCFEDNLGEVVCTECPDGYVGKFQGPIS